MAQARSAQIQQDLLASDQESLYREVMQESYNTIFRASPLQLQKSELLAHLKRGQEDWAQDLQSSSNGAGQRLVKEALKKWPEAGTWWNSYRSPVNVPTSDSSSSDDEIASEKEEEENIQWESQRIAKPRAALLGKWESVHRQGKACKSPHSRLQECHTSINCADVKKKGLVAHRNSQEEINAEEGQHECSVCGKNFGRRSSLNRHVKIHSGDKPFRCSICGKCFLVKTSLVLHKESMHKKRPRSGKKLWECHECGQNFATKAFLMEHQKMHTSEKTYPCPVCENSFMEVGYLVKHLMTAHSGEHVFKCPVCGKGFMKEKDLLRHQGKSHGSSHCFLSLDSENSCKETAKHKRLHLNHETPVPETLSYTAYEGNDAAERAHTCCHCGKSFKQERSFINHQSACLREQRGDEGSILKEDGLLAKNQITQVKMKDDTCFDCGKPVCKTPPLASQPETDEGQNLHTCPECGKSFRDGQCFANHLRSHKKAPPPNVSDREGLEGKTLPVDQQEAQQKESRYQCPSCRRDYSTHYNLRRHQQIHTECRPRRNAQKGKDSTYSWFFFDFPKACGKEPAHQHKCAYCGKAFRTKSTLSRHQQIHIKGKPYKCNICGKAFAYRYTLAHHQEVHLEDQLYQHKCSFCGKAFRTQSALRRHQQLHMDGKPYICNVCGKAFAYRYNLTHHREVHIEGQIHKCSFCWKAFRTSYSLNRHKRIHTETRSYQCPTCRKAFGTKYSLYRHQEMHVKENSDSLFSRKETGDNLVKGQASKSSDSVDKQVADLVRPPCQGVPRGKNPLEGSGNKGSSDIPRHQSTRGEENAVKQLGSLTFRNVGSVLIKDQDGHTKGQLQQRTKSSVSTGQGVQMEEHPPRPSENGEISLGVHLGDRSMKEPDDWCFLGKLPGVGQQGMIPQKKKCPCPDCGKSFRDNYSLTRHQKIHISERPHQCPSCEKSFRLSKDLEKHQVTHSDLRPHQCVECGKYFKRKSSLDKHKKIHKGEKPYCCSYCGRRVTTNTILRYHQRIHTGERPYKCTVCDKSYVTSWSLKKHLELHYKTNLPGGPQEANQLDQKC
ncbi:zinc finger protein 420-like [Candoia aspera]|uniref:zinc finger protein 420-like n=1 Tax=Candoia aspera TaxID=51853 RepID=UPI002FD84660